MGNVFFGAELYHPATATSRFGCGRTVEWSVAWTTTRGSGTRTRRRTDGEPGRRAVPRRATRWSSRARRSSPRVLREPDPTRGSDGRLHQLPDRLEHDPELSVV